MSTILILKVRGLGNSILVIDFLKKNTYLCLEKIAFEKKNGELNVILSGSTAQVNVAERIVKDFAKYHQMKYVCSKILNFDMDILSNDNEFLSI